MLDFLTKTAQHISNIFDSSRSSMSKEDIENALIETDVSYDIVENILENLNKNITRNELKKELENILLKESLTIKHIETKPIVELIFGVNGAGKTTTIAKLAAHYLTQHKKVLLGAADTFRAAAIEQLQSWGNRLGINVIASKHGADPAAIAFDTIKSGLAHNIDHIIIDTAGRIHTQTNLQKELEKIDRICSKALDNKSFRNILIIDGTQGSSAINQARIFSQTINIDGIIVTKLDGTSRGGAIFSIVYELKIPIMFLGVGEKKDDLIPFSPQSYIDGILDCIFGEDNGKTSNAI